MNAKIKVLLVEDESVLAMIIKDTLEAEGFELLLAKNGADGLKYFFDFHPDVLIADIMMPQMDGFEMVKLIRKTDLYTPILFLTARSGINDLVEGFEIGANDFLKKPFHMKELIIRIKSLVNKTFMQPKSIETNHFMIGNYSFDSVAQKLTFCGKEQELSHRESEILKRFCMHQNDVVITQNILLELWGDDSFFNTRSLHVFITKLRHKLSNDPSIRIVNVRGIGYKLIVDGNHTLQ